MEDEEPTIVGDAHPATLDLDPESLQTAAPARETRRGHRSALHAEEVGRARSMGWALGIITGICALTIPLMGGVPAIRASTALTTGLLSIFSFAVVFIVRDERAWTRGLFRTWGGLAVVASTLCEFHLGVFSPTPLAVTLGISFFGRGNDRVGGLVICLAATFAYFVMSAFMTAGLLEDPGLFSASEASIGAKLWMTGMVPLVLGATLLDGRTARATLRRVMKQASDASRRAERKEAQFEEVRQELDAMGTGRGSAGRHTGEVLGGRRLGALIGRGAVGEVYASVHEDGRQCAVKVLYDRMANEPRIVARFLQEGEIAASLSSPHVVHVHEVGVSKGGAPFIAMDLLRGKTLSELLRAEGQLQVDDAVRLAVDVGLGLDHAHAGGVIHRDIKPGNLFRAETRDGAAWKVLDFGVSKLWHSEGTLTQHDVVGTPAYMSPEQAMSHAVTTATDIYGLGAVLYRALTGRPPASGRTAVETLLRVVDHRPVRPGDLSLDVNPDLEAVLAIAMAVDPARRFPNGSELGRAAKAAARGRLPSSLRKRARALLDAHPWRPLID